MRPSPTKPFGSESFTFRQMGDFVRIELNGGVLRAAERSAAVDEYTYLTGASQTARFLQFLQLVIDSLRKVQTNNDSVAFVFRANNRWVRVEENMGTVKFSDRADNDDEYVYASGAAEDALVSAFLGYSATQLDVNLLGHV